MNDAALSCPLQRRCPGCPLGETSYREGLAQKGHALGSALARYRELAPELREPRPASPTHGYRLRAKLVSRGKALGLFERGTHRVVDVSGCRVLSPELARASQAVRRALPLPLYGADLRQTSEGVLVTLIAERESARAELAALGRRLVERDEALSVAVAVRRPGDVRLLSGEPQVVAGPGEARHAITPGAPYGYAAHGGFVQAHAGQASYVYGELARGLLASFSDTPRRRVLELFAGNGSLALSLARAGIQVTAIEAYAPAIALAERAAREQGLALRVEATDATRFAERLAPDRFDAIVVNPPRRGLDPSLRRAIGRAAPRVLAYVSCNPHTLARDAWHLQTLGLHLTRAEPLDMIPWSDAIEVLAWFSPQSPPPPRVLFENHQCVAVDKLPHDGPAETLARVRRLPGCDSVHAFDAWGMGVSGATWFVKDPALASRTEALGRELSLLLRGNLRKQGTITRAGAGAIGTPYKKQRDAGRHSLAEASTLDRDELGVAADFASVKHPILGDARGDASSNEFVHHRHGLDRPFVHVAKSRLRLASGEVVEATAELAPDLARVLESLSQRSSASD